ncbi:MAG: methyltransferase [bacterium]|nr:methyltransferase [bacterium]
MSSDEIDQTTIYGAKILQKKHGWRFSVDSVALSKFCVETELSYFKNEPKNLFLDVGTGCGVVIILIQNFLKLEEKIDHLPYFFGIDIDPDMIKIANTNMRINEVFGSVVLGDIREAPFKKNSFDIIVSNPPYIPVGEGKISQKYDIAKWEITFDLRSFVRSSSEILKSKGRIYVVYNSNRLGELLSVFFKVHLNPSFIRFYHHSKDRKSDFFVLCAQKDGKRKLEVLPPFFSDHFIW